jgi:putative CocE/NonD family hydrolase
LADLKDVPMLFVAGWYDPFTDSMLNTVAELRKLQKSEKRIVVGPWPHPYGKPVCGQATFGSDAELDERHLQLAWFDHWMKGTNSSGSAAPVKYFRMGGSGARVQDATHISPGGEWLTAAAWPPAQSKTRRLYLAQDRSLTEQTVKDDKPITYESDPHHPTATLGGRSGPTCIVNQGAERAGVVSFVGPPLENALNATGPVKVGLSISSDQVDTDFTARLIDVYPDGYAMNLAEGQIRASYRKGNGSTVPLKPGQIYEVTLELGSTSNLFAKGHRIRLDVSSSSFPRLEPNPQDGETGMWTHQVAARNSLHNGSAHPSYLELTVLPD